jgi:hypothetical protein
MILSTRNYDFFDRPTGGLEAVFPDACNEVFRGVSLDGDGGMSAGLQLMFPVFFVLNPWLKP